MYELVVGLSPSGQTTYRCNLKNRQRIPGGKPVDQIQVRSYPHPPRRPSQPQVLPQNHLLVLLCDEKVFAVDMLSLKPADDAKFVKVCCVFVSVAPCPPFRLAGLLCCSILNGA
jgi:hypothetical protein